MNIGLYFGSFNPIHTGHLIIASHVLNETDIQKLWFIVSPQNPLKTSNSLLNEYDRFFLVQKAIEDDPRMHASDIEFSLPKPSYTIHTLTYLKEKYPTLEFIIIMGSDSYQNLHRWRNYEIILQEYSIIVYTRPGFMIAEHPKQVTVLKAPLLEISATHIRELIQNKKSIKYLVPPSVEEELLKSNFFRRIKKSNP